MDIYSLLKIDSDVICDFPQLANRVVDLQIERVFNQQIRALKQIEDRMPSDKGITLSKQSIDEIVRKVVRFANANDYSSDNWSIRELRIISYYLMKLRGNDKAYEYAIALLDKNWRNLYFNGLIFYLMNSWNSIEYKYRELTSNLLIEKLKTYTDNNKRYLCLKDHLNLFENAGPARMAALLSQKNLPLIKAPEIIGFKESAINQSYYSDVIIRYVKHQDIHDLDKIEEIFNYHNLDRTRKLVLAHLVERENNNPDGLKRTQLCKFVNRILGDVTMASTWAPFIGASDEEAQELKRAMKLVNNWFTQQIIETFFEICVQDAYRKRFWLEYVNIISGFKIVGSAIIKRMLMLDNRIGTLFIKHFIETNSQTSQTSALILFIKDKMLVEFSDTGALYVYNHNHSQVKMVLQHRGWISSTSDLKIPSMGPIIEQDGWGGYDFYEEGRMVHSGNWEIRLSKWMQKMILYKEISFSPFINNQQEENLFHAKPLPVESTINILNENENNIKAESKDNSKVNDTNKFEVVTRSNTNEQNATNIYQNQKDSFQQETILTDISYTMTSEWLKENYRIVGNCSGIYLYNSLKNQFILIKQAGPVFKYSGSIIVKDATMLGWKEIILLRKGIEYPIGFIKEAKFGKGYLFKTNMSLSAKRRLYFK